MTKRSKILTVLFSALPGAGQMFLGYMKTGLSFMVMFFGIIMLSVVLQAEVLLFAIVIVWFYSFFDCINKAFPRDEATMIEDKYILIPEPFPIFVGKQRPVLGWCLTLLGLYILADSTFNLLASINWDWYVAYIDPFRRFLNLSPQFVIAIVIMVLGILMIIGKKKELEAGDSTSNTSKAKQ